MIIYLIRKLLNNIGMLIDNLKILNNFNKFKHKPTIMNLSKNSNLSLKREQLKTLNKK
jgi:hypothetical protein